MKKGKREIKIVPHIFIDLHLKDEQQKLTGHVLHVYILNKELK